jgi:hypothetical protein
MSSDDDIRNAIKAIDAKKKAIKSIRASIVRGGATGMVQQSNLKSYPKRKPKDDYIYPGIKDLIKKKHNHIDIVFIHGAGNMYFVVEEDARYIHKKYHWEYKDQWPFDQTCFGRSKKLKYIKDLQLKNKTYAFLDIIPNTNPIIRKIIDSSDISIIGDKY